MKKSILKILCVVSALFIVSSCSKDENCKYENSTFIGKWKLTKVQNKTSGADITAAYFADPHYECEDTNITEFKSNGIASQIVVLPCEKSDDIKWSLSSSNGANFIEISENNSSNALISKSLVNIVSCNDIEVTSETTEEKYTITRQ